MTWIENGELSAKVGVAGALGAEDWARPRLKESGAATPASASIDTNSRRETDGAVNEEDFMGRQVGG
jgi:hypothetical protein